MFINVFLFILLLTSSITDIRKRKILNSITFPAMVTGLLYNTVLTGWDGFLFSLYGILLGFGLLMIPYILGGMGAGDVKLLGAIGALKGASFVFGAFIYIALIGGIIAIIILLKNKGLFDAFKRIQFSILTRSLNGLNQSEMNGGIPYGVPISVGTVIYFGVNV
jgi:prepilin peptidase CpaA